MLAGVVPFPPDFAQRYRERGYWIDKTLAQEYREVFKRFGDRVGLIDGNTGTEYRYRDLDELSTNLALNLLELGLRPLDRVVVQLPNFAEISQFTELSGAAACVTPDRSRDFDYTAMVERIRGSSSTLKYPIVFGSAPAGFSSLADLIEKPARLTRDKLEEIDVDPADPCIFQLSGGTTGIPKLIPRTHNDYAYNSKRASEVCNITGGSVILIVLPIAHNLPLACPGIQGALFNGGSAVVSASTKPEDICALIEKYRATHLKVVPALLIRIINDPSVTAH